MFISNADAAFDRVEACALTELALGETRPDTCFKLLAVAVAMLSEVDERSRAARDVAQWLHDLADQVEARCGTS